jgi:arylsulfatase A-like enzyme
MTDQQRVDTIRAHGYDHMVTPATDVIVNNGVSFRNAFCCGATCIVSRAALFTGMHAQNTGAYSFYPWAHQRSWVHDLRDAGYHCVNIGKMHLDPKYDHHAFHERVIVENPSKPTTKWGEVDDEWGRYLALNGKERIGFRHETDEGWRKRLQAAPWHMEEQYHPDVYVGNEALGWIRRHVPQEPVFLQIGFTGPHEPYDPLQRHLDLYRDAELPQPIRRPGELEEKPPQQAAHLDFNNRFHHECQIGLPEATDAAIDNMRRHYYAKITTVDEKIGEIFDALDRAGYLEEAIVILTSDHGDMLGDHHLPYKWFMYENVVHVPLVIWDTRKNEGTERSELVSHIDLGPTILDIAGVDAPRHLEGRSLLTSLGPSGRGKRREYVAAQDNYMTMIRTERAKLVWYAYQEGDGELYDLESDPGELYNLFQDPGSAALLAEMKDRLIEWTMRSGYRTAGFKNGRADTPLFWPQESPYLHHAVKIRPDSWYDIPPD